MVLIAAFCITILSRFTIGGFFACLVAQLAFLLLYNPPDPPE